MNIRMAMKYFYPAHTQQVVYCWTLTPDRSLTNLHDVVGYVSSYIVCESTFSNRICTFLTLIVHFRRKFHPFAILASAVWLRRTVITISACIPDYSCIRPRCVTSLSSRAWGSRLRCLVTMVRMFCHGVSSIAGMNVSTILVISR